MLDATEIIKRVDLDETLFRQNYVNHSHAYGHYVKFSASYGKEIMTEEEYNVIREYYLSKIKRKK